jgi:chromosome partitioning protein
MATIVAIANEKGGSGKTPTAINLAFALNRAGKVVKLVDLDPQASITKYFLDDDYTEIEYTLYHALHGRRIAAVQIRDGLAFLPAINGQVPLVNAEIELPQKYRFDFQKRLARALAFYKDDDYLIVDTPGNVSMFTVLALAAADLVVVPVKSERSAEQATDDIMDLISQVQGTEVEPGLNPDLKLWGILPTLYESRVKHHNQVVEILRYKYKGLVYPEASKKSNEYNNAHVLKTDVSARDAELGRYWDRVAASIINGGFSND